MRRRPRRSCWPTGTVTFLFTDIEGSTERWARGRGGDDRGAGGSRRGSCAGSSPNRTASCSSTPVTGSVRCSCHRGAAVRAASVAQTRLELPVRMGVHTGEAQLRDGDYFGPTLNRVARIMDAGHGGQILLSRATAALASDSVTADLGEHRPQGAGVARADLPAGERRVPGAPGRHRPQGQPALTSRPSSSAATRSSPTWSIGSPSSGWSPCSASAARARRVWRSRPGTWRRRRSPTDVGWSSWHASPCPRRCPTPPATVSASRSPESGDLTEFVVNRLRHQRLLLVLDNCEHVLERGGRPGRRRARRVPGGHGARNQPRAADGRG